MITTQSLRFTYHYDPEIQGFSSNNPVKGAKKAPTVIFVPGGEWSRHADSQSKLEVNEWQNITGLDLYYHEYHAS